MKHLAANKVKGLTTFNLKVIGIILMFIDHIYEMFAHMGAPDWLDWFGRPVAILFFFLSVIGFSYTRSKKKYLLQLYIGMLLMTLGSDLLQRFVSYTDVQLMNNIFRDLLVGGLMMYGIDKIAVGFSEKRVGAVLFGSLLIFFPIITSVILTMLLMIPKTVIIAAYAVKVVPALMFTENSFMVLLIPFMYLARNYRWLQCLFIALVAAFFFTQNQTQWLMIRSVPLILLFNGEKGRSMKTFFYFFYSLHIWLLYLLSAFVASR
ncbi:hypothetical protein M2139_001829 [Enterococcus sp. PF1-24]|uniref:TraX family protein n=1 Tax=unclassified Enterococcus TaxID=2608891 RepID=UPI002474F3F2|nr:MULTISPECIES: TraX family protein [unclassified Enterococcus]MDH6364847.1 hypothetical protein [Enterococcus sp. PFB1-1]MDH6401929.1 hypothetical protein [Enterococcus sp. PF1-24]